MEKNVAESGNLILANAKVTARELLRLLKQKKSPSFDSEEESIA